MRHDPNDLGCVRLGKSKSDFPIERTPKFGQLHPSTTASLMFFSDFEIFELKEHKSGVALKKGVLTDFNP